MLSNHFGPSKHLSVETAPIRTAKLCRESCAWLSASQGLLSPPCRTSTSNAVKAELLKSSKSQITPVTISSFYCHLASASGAWWQKLRDLGGASSLRHQAPKLKLSLITSTWLHLMISKIFIILHHPYSCYVNTLYNLFAHSSCTYLLILLISKKKTENCKLLAELCYYVGCASTLLLCTDESVISDHQSASDIVHPQNCK